MTINVTVTGGADTRTDIEDSGGTVVADATGAAFTASGDASVAVTDDGDGSATVDYSVTTGGGSMPDTVVEAGGDPVSAINNASAGEHVHIKADTYTISTGIELNASGVTVTGDGMGQTVLFVDGSANIYPFRIGNTAAVTDIRLAGFTIDGNYANHTGPYSNMYHGLFGQDVTRCHVERVEVKNTYPYSGNDDTSAVSHVVGGGDGILFDGGWKGTSEDVYLTQCYTHDCQWRGIDTWGNGMHVSECISLDNVDRGISGNNSADHDDTHGYFGAGGWFVTDSRATGGTHPASAIAIRDATEEAVVRGCKVTADSNGNGRDLIVMESHDRGVVRDCFIDVASAGSAIRIVEHDEVTTAVNILDNHIYATADNDGSELIDLGGTANEVAIRGNVVDGTNLTSTTAIDEQGSGINTLSIVDNRFVDLPGDVILLRGNVDGAIITLNHISNFGSNSIAVNWNSTGEDNHVVVANIIEGGNNDFRVQKFGDGLVVTGNLTRNISFPGVGPHGADSVVGANLLRSAGDGDDNRTFYDDDGTKDLGGTDQSISISDHGRRELYKVSVDAGGSVTTLEGIDGPTHDGQSVLIEHTGGEDVTLADDDANATNPLKNQSGANDTLSAGMARYTYDGSAWRQEWINTQA